MDDPAAAAAVVALSVDDTAWVDTGTDSTLGTLSMTEALRPIDVNTGERKSPDSPSNCPPVVWGAQSSYVFLTFLTVFGLGRDLR